jgi:predicted ribosomally synthesized peptide with SipW-like signal peptide
MKKIIGLSLVLIIAVALSGIGTFAYLTDHAASSGNSFVAGTLDLKTNDADGVTQTLYAVGMSPGATVNSPAITLKNTGTVNGATMDIVFSYVEGDGTPNTVPRTADDTAATIEVITLNYGGSSLLSSIVDSNLNGYLDLFDLKNANFSLSGLNAGASKNFDISVRLRSETPNDFQGDGIAVTMTFTLKQ